MANNNANSNNRVSRLKDRLQKERQARIKERAQLKELQKTVKDLEKRPTAEDVQKRTAELQGKVRTRAYRDAFEAECKAAKVKPEHVGDLFDLAKLAMDKDDPDPKVIKDRVGELVKDRAWAIQAEESEGDDDNQEDPNKGQQQQQQSKEKLPKDDNAGRGRASGAAGHFNVRRSQLSDKNWMRQNQAAYAEAIRAGTVNIIG